jgi:hypothetical protein
LDLIDKAKAKHDGKIPFKFNPLQTLKYIPISATKQVAEKVEVVEEVQETIS